MGFYQFIDETNKETLNKPVDADRVYCSVLNSWYTRNAFRSVGIKCVLEGSICYDLGKKQIIVEKDDFLIASRKENIIAQFEEPKTVKSICIDISPQTYAEGLDYYTNGFSDPDRIEPGFVYPEFSECCGSLNVSRLGMLVKGISIDQKREHFPVSKEWFLEIVDCILSAQFPEVTAYKRMDAVKASTKKEILRRLKAGKQFMELNFMNELNITEIAKAACFSQFHFYRSFRQCFGITPGQYLLQLRMDFAKRLLSTTDMSVTEIARLAKYSDISTFSRAYHRFYGVMPSAARSDRLISSRN
jgi:AraC-like DNA-binding protein